jgi:hypothetical protein
MKQSAWILLGTLSLVGCGGDEATIVDESDTMTEETSITDSTTEETAQVDSGGGETTGEGGTDAPATDAPSDAPATDAPADTAAPTIKCGTMGCNPSTQVCCVPTVGGMASCIDKAATCAGGKLACASPDTCGGGQKCCLSAAGSAGGSECKASCNMAESEMCDDNSDCAMGKTCKNIGAAAAGYKRCE